MIDSFHRALFSLLAGGNDSLELPNHPAGVPTALGGRAETSASRRDDAE
jgi:hypothetical protein